MSDSKHLRRVVRKLGVDDDVVARLAALQAGDVRAVLLDLVARRAASLRPADVLRRYETEASFWPSAIDPAAYRRFETRALSVLPDEFVELVLAPHAPLGTSSVLGSFSQDRVMTNHGRQRGRERQHQRVGA